MAARLKTNRIYILGLLFVSLLLLHFTPQAQAAGKSRAAAKTSEYDELPAINWKLVSSGFMRAFKARAEEIESAGPGRFFPGVVAFAMRNSDSGGHFLMLSCGNSVECSGRRDVLEDRMVNVCFLDSVHTPKIHKAQLYDTSTWELTSMGEDYLARIRKRHPDLPRRLGRMVFAAIPPR